MTRPVFDFDAFDRSVRPQDDLYRHVNGRWLQTAEIPSDKPLTGAFMVLVDQAEEAVRDIITGLEMPSGEEDAARDPGADAGTAAVERKIADLYASFMDVDRIEAAGAEPIRGLLDEVDAVGSVEDLVRLQGSFVRRAVRGLVDLEAESDPGDPQRYVMFVGQSGIGLPDEEYYRLDSYAAIRDAYGNHIAASLQLAGVADAQTAAATVLDLETKIAAAHWDKVRTRDMRAMYNLMPLTDFVSISEGLHFRTFLSGAGIEEQTFAEVVVTQPSFFSDAAELLTDELLPAWKTWATWRIVSSLSPYLSSAFVDERFRFYGTTLMGTPVLKERWKRGVDLVEGALGEAVGKVYVERHFPAAAKERIDTLVANLITAYHRSISALDWMTEETKARALDKLSKFRPKIGYPSTWRDYSQLQIDRGDLVGNVMRAHEFELNRSVAKIGAPIDRDEWLMTPQTVNAYYHPLRNEIVFPAAILQPPFFDPEADDAVNYGGIGAVIGHEIGHGFDDQGSTCDGDGRLVDWWTEADRAAFEERTKVLIAQYDALEPAQAPGHQVNGGLTIGENIGDLGGLAIAYQAYRIALDGQEPDPIDDLTGDQRLFYNWGTVWRQKARDEAVLQRLATDPHSPPEFRCNQILRNLDEFYGAFGLSETDALWLDDGQRVKIW